jgi:tetratricopeptide (TPR) repeat protein
VASGQLWENEQADWLDRLDLEHANYRAILAWCRDHDSTTGLRLVKSLWRFWVDRGYLTEGRDWLESTLERVPKRTWLRARTLYGLGYLLEVYGETTSAMLAHEESRGIFEEVGDQAGVGVSLVRLGRVAMFRGEHQTARGHLQRGLRILSSLGDLSEPGVRVHIALGEVELGEIARLEGDNQRADDLFEQALNTFSRLRSQRGLSYAHWRIGRLRLSEGRHGEARRALEESLRLARAINQGHNTYNALVELATLARVEGDYAEARSRLEECLAFCRENGRQDKVGSVQLNLAKLALLAGGPDQAAALLRDSLLDARGRDDPPHRVACLGLAGLLAIRQGARCRGTRLIAAVIASPELLVSALDLDERQALQAGVEEARETLGEPCFSQAWVAGQALTLGEAVEEALRGEA